MTMGVYKIISCLFFIFIFIFYLGHFASFSALTETDKRQIKTSGGMHARIFG
jgi:hypothetical protein